MIADNLPNMANPFGSHYSIILPTRHEVLDQEQGVDATATLEGERFTRRLEGLLTGT